MLDRVWPRLEDLVWIEEIVGDPPLPANPRVPRWAQYPDCQCGHAFWAHGRPVYRNRLGITQLEHHWDGLRHNDRNYVCIDRPMCQCPGYRGPVCEYSCSWPRQRSGRWFDLHMLPDELGYH